MLHLIDINFLVSKTKAIFVERAIISKPGMENIILGPVNNILETLSMADKIELT